jgi:hypothetical protein
MDAHKGSTDIPPRRWKLIVRSWLNGSGVDKEKRSLELEEPKPYRLKRLSRVMRGVVLDDFD